MYNQGSVNSQSSNIQVRFKFYVLKIFKNLFYTGYFANIEDLIHRGYT